MFMDKQEQRFGRRKPDVVLPVTGVGIGDLSLDALYVLV